jgi:hypothetical protein
MKIGNREFSGKGAREDAGNALGIVVMSWKDDQTLKVRGHFKGFEILSRGGPFNDSEPELFIRGKETYRANLNPENPSGTIQSIEHVLRSLDRKAEDERQDIEGRRKPLPITKRSSAARSSTRPVLKTSWLQQAQLNAALDLDKHDAQVVAETPKEPENAVQAGFAARVRAEGIGSTITAL